jgi:hypothetical protein
MMATGQPRRSAYFSWLPFCRCPEIHFGADAGGAQLRHHLLVAAEAVGVAIHHQHDDRREILALVSSLPRFFSAVIRRETPMEKPVAGTGSPRKRETRPS